MPEWIPLAISVFALLFAGLSWRAAHRSATAAEKSAAHAEEVATIERQRQHEERRPVWDITGREINDKALIEFRLTQQGPELTYSVLVEPGKETTVPGLRPEGDAEDAALIQVDDLELGSDFVFYGSAYGRRRGQMRIIVTLSHGDESWREVRDFDINWRSVIW